MLSIKIDISNANKGRKTIFKFTTAAIQFASALMYKSTFENYDKQGL